MRDNDVTFREIASPIGTLLLTGTRTHLTGLYMDAHLRGPKPAPGWRHDERAFAAAVEQLAAYRLCERGDAGDLRIRHVLPGLGHF